MTLVDADALLDLVTNAPLWTDWSIEQVEAANLADPLLINDTITPDLRFGTSGLKRSIALSKTPA